jgi:cutinase
LGIIMRRFITATVLASTCLASVAVATPAEAAARVVTTGCAKVTIIGARGSGQFLGTAGLGQLSGFGPQVANAATNAVSRLSPLTTVRYDRLLYPAVDADFYQFRSGAYAASVASGIARLNVQVAYFVRTCPSTKIFLIGYSQGAEIMHRGAAQLAPSVATHISGVALISDTLRNVNDPNTFDFQVGGLATNNGAFGGGPLFTNGLGARVASFCNVSDWVCNRTGLPSFFAHTEYYQTPVARAWIGKWVASRMIRSGAL